MRKISLRYVCALEHCNLNRETADPRRNHKLACNRVYMDALRIQGRERSVQVACKNRTVETFGYVELLDFMERVDYLR